jgi:hypothetical protein
MTTGTGAGLRLTRYSITRLGNAAKGSRYTE